jgi:hypothetical protein
MLRFALPRMAASTIPSSFRFLLIGGLTAVALVLGSLATTWAQGPGNSVNEPEIYDFQITWTHIDGTLDSYVFTVSGKTRYCEDLDDPRIVIEGYPFDKILPLTGSFSYSQTETGQNGFGRVVSGVIENRQLPVSAQAYATT